MLVVALCTLSIDIVQHKFDLRIAWFRLAFKHVLPYHGKLAISHGVQELSYNEYPYYLSVMEFDNTCCLWSKFLWVNGMFSQFYMGTILSY